MQTINEKERRKEFIMKKENSMAKLFAYAGNYKYLTIASWILSAFSVLLALLPFLLYLAGDAGGG